MYSIDLGKIQVSELTNYTLGAISSHLCSLLDDGALAIYVLFLFIFLHIK